MKPRIILSGGGTGGSVTPLLALADVLKDDGADLLFVGTTDGPEQALVDQAHLPWKSIPAGKLRRYASWKNIRDMGRLWQGYRAAQSILDHWRPDAVVAAGSYVAVPLVWAAHRRGIGVVIHQQDVQPGLANRLMAPAADRITINFPASRKDFPAGKTILIGNPVRPAIFLGSVDRARRRFDLDPHRLVLLIMGGGTGSEAINRLVAGMLPDILASWEVIHLTGHHRGPVIQSQPHYHPFTFLTEDLPDALAAADLVVSRAGLGVLTELMALGKPGIIIPMPQTHQVANAQYLADQQAAVVLDQAGLTPHGLVKAIAQLQTDEARRSRLSTNITKLFHPTATADLAQCILDIARHEAD